MSPFARLCFCSSHFAHFYSGGGGVRDSCHVVFHFCLFPYPYKGYFRKVVYIFETDKCILSKKITQQCKTIAAVWRESTAASPLPLSFAQIIHAHVSSHCILSIFEILKTGMERYVLSTLTAFVAFQ